MRKPAALSPRHEFAAQAYAFALAALGAAYQKRHVEGEQYDLERLALMGAAQAIQEAWVGDENRSSAACRLHHNWVGISPCSEQKHVGQVRIFATDAECWESWAYLVLDSTRYDDARANLETSLVFWSGVKRDGHAYDMAMTAVYKKFAVLFGQAYCPENKAYGADVLSIMGEIGFVCDKAAT